MTFSERTLMRILRDAVKKAPSGLTAEQIADRLGKRYPTLMGELNESIPSHKLGLLDALEVIQLTKSEEAKVQIGHMLGCAYFKLPEVRGRHGKACRTMVQAVKEFGDVARAYEEACDPNSEGGSRISADERQKIIKEGYEAVAKILEFVESVECDS